VAIVNRPTFTSLRGKIRQGDYYHAVFSCSNGSRSIGCCQCESVSWSARVGPKRTVSTWGGSRAAPSGAAPADVGTWRRRIGWWQKRVVLDPDDSGGVRGALGASRQAGGEDVLDQVYVGVLVPDGVARLVAEASAAAELRSGLVC
jgi:hypothetical protein